VRRDQRGGDTGLHVVGATAVQAVAVDARDMRVGHALDRHRVEVAAEQQRPPATGPTRADEHRGAAGRVLERRDLESASRRPARDVPRDLRLARAARDERGVDRVDRDEISKQRGQLRAHAPDHPGALGRQAAAAIARSRS
jgi:hypothetical protein